jgi:autotransporter passenger strand-loop-strand repeat protein
MSGITINDGGNFYVVGGITSSTTVNGTEAIIYGGIARGSVINSGGISYVQGGVASGTILRGGVEFVELGGVTSGTTISGGYAAVAANGTAIGMVVSATGTDYVQGGVASGTILRGGVEFVDLGGVTSGTTISGGYAAVAANGTAIGMVVSATGTDYVQGGVASGTILRGGVEFVDLGGVTSGTTISGGYAAIAATGTAIGMIVSSGAIDYVQGGITSGTILRGGIEFVELGGVTSGTTISAGYAAIAATGTAIGMIVSSGAIDYVQGGITSGTILRGGIEFVELGGVTSGTTISAGYAAIAATGTAIGMIVSSGAIDYVQGGVTSGTILRGGVEFVELGGVTSGTTISAGYAAIAATGTAIGMVVSSGAIDYVQGGVASGTILRGGVEVVELGGVTSGTTISSGGAEYVSNTTATSTIVLGGGQLYVVGGLTSGATVSGGLELATTGATTQGTVISSGGLESVYTGSVAVGTTVYDGGDLYVSSGITSNATIGSGGLEQVLSGGITQTTSVSSGGGEYLYSGAAASNTTVSSGGELFIIGGVASGTTVNEGLDIVQSGGATSNTTLLSGSVLIVDSGGIAVGTEVGSGAILVEMAGSIINGVTIASEAIVLNTNLDYQPNLPIALDSLLDTEQLSALTGDYVESDATVNSRPPRDTSAVDYLQSATHVYGSNDKPYGSNFAQANAIATGAGVLIEVIDHYGFDAKVVANPSPLNARAPQSDPADSHINKVSSVIGNSEFGLAKDATIIGYGAPTAAEVIQGYKFAIDNNVRVTVGAFHFSKGETFRTALKFNASYIQATKVGANGLGISVIISAGNGHLVGEDVSAGTTGTGPYTTVVAAVDQTGAVAGFSSRGASVFLAAIGTGVATLRSSTSAISYDTGTSVAAPIVASVVALMYQVDPNLGWRDVREILSQSTYPATGESLSRLGTGTWNGGGLVFNNDVGFGIIDANTAVNLARAWTPGLTSANMMVSTGNGTINSGSGSASSMVGITAAERVETATVSFIGLQGYLLSDLTISLVSPSGTVSDLVANTGQYTVVNGDQSETLSNGSTAPVFLTSNAFWGQQAAGDWTLKLTTKTGQPVLTHWTLTLNGDSSQTKFPLVYTPVFDNDDVLRTIGDRYFGAPLVDGTKSSTLDLIALPHPTEVELGGGKGQIDGVPVWYKSGIDTVNLQGTTGTTTINSTLGNNTFHLGSGSATVNGAGGNDFIYADIGPSTVNANNDSGITFIGGSGTAAISLGSGDAKITAGTGVEKITVAQNTQVALFTGLSRQDTINIPFLSQIDGAAALSVQDYHKSVNGSLEYTEIKLPGGTGAGSRR